MKTYEIVGRVNYDRPLLSAEFSAIVSEKSRGKAKNLLEKKLKGKDKSIQSLTIQSLTIDKIIEIDPNKEGVLSCNISSYR